MTTFNKDIMNEVYGSMVDRMNRNFEMMDRLEYERPYTEAEKERCQDISNMERQYWHDQYALALSTFPSGFLDTLRLHRPNENVNCQGCDVGGWEGESPPWPCRTIKVAITGDEDYELLFERPKRPRRKHQSKYITVPVHARRTP